MQDRIGYAYKEMSHKKEKGNYTIGKLIASHLRIYGLAFIITFSSEVLSIQSIFIVYSSLLLITIMGVGKPFASPSIARVEIANEFFILVLFSFILCQTDLVPQIEGRNMTGWIIIGLTCAFIVVNFGLEIISSFKEMQRRLKFWYIRKQKI